MNKTHIFVVETLTYNENLYVHFVAAENNYLENNYGKC